MGYRCAPPRVEYYTVMSCAILYVVICLVILAFILTKRPNLFRLACLITVCGELITLLTTTIACSIKARDPSQKYVLQLIVMLMKGFAALLFDFALLKLGRSYRPPGLRNTRLFIAAASTTTLACLLMAPFMTFYKLSVLDNDYINVYQVFSYLETATRYLAFLLSIMYAFFPMFAIHGVSNSPPYYSIDARTAAFGTYYMVIAALWFIFLLVFDIITNVGVPKMVKYSHVAFFISAVMNSSAPLAFGLQAPYWFVERVRRSILGRTINRIVIVERGVLSTGILEGKVYESPL